MFGYEKGVDYEKQVNILVGDDHEARITDFGISCLLDESLSRDTTLRHTSVQGTSRWTAPECLEGNRATKASDVYSFAMTTWEVSLCRFQNALLLLMRSCELKDV